MIALGIETSCDETAVAVLKNGKKILSNVIVSSLDRHRPFGGVVPEIASRSHLETILNCLEAALKKAKITPKDIDLVAVTQGPGLMGSLLVGLSAAKALAFSLKKPLVGVDHVIAHIYAGFLENPRLKFPVLGLVVSGGHTLIVRMDGPSEIKILGKTVDDAAGEAFDKVAKILGLGYPGGPEVDRLSRGQASPQISFTRPFLSKDSLDFSFSGLKTAVLYKVESIKKKKALSLKAKKEICAAFQAAVCDVLVAKTVRAAKKEALRTIVVGGGVSANSKLRTDLEKAGRREGIRVLFPSKILCQDNAAMIAGLGTALYGEGKQNTLDLSSYSDFRHGGARC